VNKNDKGKAKRKIKGYQHAGIMHFSYGSSLLTGLGRTGMKNPADQSDFVMVSGVIAVSAIVLVTRVNIS